MDILIKEYEITYNNYRFTFEQSLNVAKFFMTVISIFFVGLVLKPDILESLTSKKFGILFILGFFLFFGIVTTYAQLGIVQRRRKCVHRMNFLRKSICEHGDLNNIHDQYCELAGFNRMITNPSFKAFGFSSWLPMLFSGIVTLVVVVVFLIILL